jgi:predicted RNA binding protein YcfA (HicA-like mRNA interferase family)
MSKKLPRVTANEIIKVLEKLKITLLIKKSNTPHPNIY